MNKSIHRVQYAPCFNCHLSSVFKVFGAGVAVVAVVVALLAILKTQRMEQP